jgi:hypothetical protein
LAESAAVVGDRAATAKEPAGRAADGRPCRRVIRRHTSSLWAVGIKNRASERVSDASRRMERSVSMRGQARFFDGDDRLQRLSDLRDQREAFRVSGCRGFRAVPSLS